jgi:hypothetical protein
VVLVPGHHCFGISAPLPPGTLESEHSGVALLAIEQASPFPIEHLATGHIVPAPGDGIVATAVYRRKLAPADLELWKETQAVLPEYAAFLCARSIPAGAIVVLETGACVTALEFGNGGAPQRIVSRAVTSEGGSDPAAQARELVLAKLQSGGPLSRINSMPAGQVVTMGASDARQAIGVAVISHSNSDGEFNEQMQRNLGFAR